MTDWAAFDRAADRPADRRSKTGGGRRGAAGGTQTCSKRAWFTDAADRVAMLAKIATPAAGGATTESDFNQVIHVT